MQEGRTKGERFSPVFRRVAQTGRVFANWAGKCPSSVAVQVGSAIPQMRLKAPLCVSKRLMRHHRRIQQHLAGIV